MGQNLAFLNAVAANGGVVSDEIRASFGVAAEGDEFTRESIATMAKGDVKDLLEAHGVEDIPKGVDEMRTLAVNVAFSDL